MLLLAPPSEIPPGPLARVVPALAKALGRQLTVDRSVRDVLFVVRLQSAADGDRVLASIARLACAEWKKEDDGTLTLRTDPEARNAFRERLRRDRVALWKKAIDKAKERLRETPDWERYLREIAQNEKGGLNRWTTEKWTKREELLLRSPRGRLADAILTEIDPATLGTNGWQRYGPRSGEWLRYGPRAGRWVRALTPGMARAVKRWVKESTDWSDLARRNGLSNEAAGLWETETVGKEEVTSTTIHVIGNHANVRMYDRNGHSMGTASLTLPFASEFARAEEKVGKEPPRARSAIVRDRQKAWYPEAPPLDLPAERLARIWNVRRDDPILGVAEPFLAYCETRRRSVVAMLGDYWPQPYGETFVPDVLPQEFWTPPVEVDGILELPSVALEPLTTASRERLAERIAAAVKDPSLFGRAERAWADANENRGAAIEFLPRLASVGADPSVNDLSDPRWLALLGAVPAGLRSSLAAGIPSRTVGAGGGQILQELAENAGYMAEPVAKDPTAAVYDPIMQWPNGVPDGTLRLELKTTPVILLSGATRRTYPNPIAPGNIAAWLRSGLGPDGKAAPDLSRVYPAMLQEGRVIFETPILRFSGRVQGYVVHPAQSAGSLPAPWRS